MMIKEVSVARDLLAVKYMKYMKYLYFIVSLIIVKTTSMTHLALQFKYYAQ
jgi:hypothetical protein